MRSLTALLLVLALAGLGCFKSSTLQASSESSSKVASSPFKWSSSSSSRDDDDTSEDVASVTEAWARSGHSADAFRTELSRIAEEDGVSDWETDPGIHVAIGRGLKRSQVSGQRLAAIEEALAGGNLQALAWMQQGYERETLD